MADTPFARWRAQHGFSYNQAAFKLGISASQVTNLEIGTERTTGRPAKLTMLHRYAMAAITHGVDPIPAEMPVVKLDKPNDTELLARLALAAAMAGLQPWPKF